MRGIGGGMGGITPEQNVVETMVVDITMPSRRRWCGRGIALDTLGNNGDKNQKMVCKAVEKMFKQYP